MRPNIARILSAPNDPETRALVADLPDETALRELMDTCNWDDGYVVPLAVVRHPRCDRGLALQLFWALDDAARTMARHDPRDQRRCTLPRGRWS
ncbi:DUF4274 domain-containing protein [Phytoactinopolyspora limicola]|uniref:DUF4274 domain-containing protein n=1 Tax=Phytoactinopolyspora limicola TaxID=2715536 RepID=UPI00140DE120|nr:DUF4274 domain-containing protein [Phytoactinopolyspora limicola]